jgi:glycosyltransferase involved in cell wall biosynthesis
MDNGIKFELIVFSNYRVGGMKSYYQNILSNNPFPFIKIKWILLDNIAEKNAPRPQTLPDFCESQVFQLLPEDTVYTSARKLSRLISDIPGVILTNGDTELSTLHLYRKKNKTIFFVCHDELYLKDACKFEFIIDCFIAHNYYFYEKLIELMPSRKADIRFMPYGVKIPHIDKTHSKSQPLRIIIISRLYESKGVRDIPVIDDLLRKNQIEVNWMIVGNGPERPFLISSFAAKNNISFFAPESNDEVLELARQNDIFILPSRLDGLPVALLEAMSVGCVPLISQFNEGIKRVVTENEGFIVPVGDNQAFAEKIIKLHTDRTLLENLSINCRKKIISEFNVKERAEDYFNLFNNFLNLKRPVNYRIPIYGVFLDYPFIPLIFRKMVRRILSYIRNLRFKI